MGVSFGNTAHRPDTGALTAEGHNWFVDFLFGLIAGNFNGWWWFAPIRKEPVIEFANNDD